jgi:hypothetical protein
MIWHGECGKTRKPICLDSADIKKLEHHENPITALVGELAQGMEIK